MDATLTQYRKMAYLSYQLIIHFKELQYTDTETILSMDVKHINDSHYQLVVCYYSETFRFYNCI